MAAATAERVERRNTASTRMRDQLAQAFFAWRTEPGFGRLEAVVLALWAVIVGTTLPLHEMWSDEGQAWVLARDNSFWQIVRHRLHYEGAPPLWHVTLRSFYLLHGRYHGIGWLGATIALLGIVVWLRWSPFPLAARMLAPFTFFLVYQYAVIARSYVYFPLLVFALCVLFRRKRHPVWFAVVAGLLANLSLQGFVFASILISLYLFDLYREHRLWFERRRLYPAAAVFALCAFVSMMTAIPAPDINFAAAAGRAHGVVRKFIEQYVGETPTAYPRALADEYIPPDPELPKPSLAHPAEWAAWQINHREIVDAQHHLAPQSKLSATVENIVGLWSQAAWPLSTSNLLAGLFLAAVIVWLRARRGLRFLIPWAAILITGQVLWVADQHAGMLLITLLAAVWLAADSPHGRPASPKIEHAFLAIFTFLLLLQAGWSWVSIRNDRRGAYDPGAETARWLHGWMDRHPGARIASFTYFAESIQPEFDRNPFFNVPASYWGWSWRSNPDGNHRRVIASNPDLVVIAAEFQGHGQMRNQWAPISHFLTHEQQQELRGDRIAMDLRAHGYRETHRFCGMRFARLSSSYNDCDIIFEPDPKWVNTRPIHDPIDDITDPAW
jgi:hypothetical protein